MPQLKTIIQPHGGKLIDCQLTEQEQQKALLRASTLPQLTLSIRNLADLECVATGVYSPLSGFVTEAEYLSVVKDMRLTNGLAWSIPVTLQVPESVANLYQLDAEIALTHPSGIILAVMTIVSKFKPNQEVEAQKVYQATDENHPGVRAMLQEGEVYIGGPIQLINPIPSSFLNKGRVHSPGMENNSSIPNSQPYPPRTRVHHQNIPRNCGWIISQSFSWPD
jgi:sulfate adenylyltransferase